MMKENMCSALNEQVIDQVLHHIERQGELLQCTRAIEEP